MKTVIKFSTVSEMMSYGRHLLLTQELNKAEVKKRN